MNWYKIAKESMNEDAKIAYQKYIQEIKTKDLIWGVITDARIKVENLTITPIFQDGIHNLKIKFTVLTPYGYNNIFPKSIKSFLQTIEKDIKQKVGSYTKNYPVVEMSFKPMQKIPTAPFLLLKDEYENFLSIYNSCELTKQIANNYNIETLKMGYILETLGLKKKTRLPWMGSRTNPEPESEKIIENIIRMAFIDKKGDRDLMTMYGISKNKLLHILFGYGTRKYREKVFNEFKGMPIYDEIKQWINGFSIEGM